MTWWWTHTVAAISDVIPLSLLTALLLLVAIGLGAGLYWWPGWARALGRALRGFFPWLSRLARRLGRLARWLAHVLVHPLSWWRGARRILGWIFRRRVRTAKDIADSADPISAPDDEELPDLPVEQFLSTADWLAAQGRYAEAIRERLRATVRAMVNAGLIENHPGWTITELATAAGVRFPPIRPPVDAATTIFSTIWYGQRPAEPRHDAHMREQFHHVRDLLTTADPGGNR